MIKKMKGYCGWADAWILENDLISMVIVSEIGPRILEFKFKGKENCFFIDKRDLGSKGGDSWKLYGGHRLWTAPEDPVKTYAPDNFSVKSEQYEDCLVLTSRVDSVTGLVKELRISISDSEPKAIINHRIKNNNDFGIRVSVWPVTAMDPAGTAFVPQKTAWVDYKPNRTVALWACASMGDSRVTWGKDYVILRQEPSIKEPFKCGLVNESGWAAYWNKGTLFVVKYPYFNEAVYPDSGSSFELFVNDSILELETPGPLINLQPGESAELVQEWRIFPWESCPRTETEITSVADMLFITKTE